MECNHARTEVFKDEIMATIVKSDFSAEEVICILNDIVRSIEVFALDAKVCTFVGLQLDRYGRVKRDGERR